MRSLPFTSGRTVARVPDPGRRTRIIPISEDSEGRRIERKNELHEILERVRRKAPRPAGKRELRLPPPPKTSFINVDAPPSVL